MAQEAERHPNGVTIFYAGALRKLLPGRQCEAKPHDKGGADRALARAKERGYVPLEYVWTVPVYIPKGERQ